MAWGEHSIGNVSEEVSLWAIKYFEDNREVLQVFDINNEEQLIKRVLWVSKASKS